MKKFNLKKKNLLIGLVAIIFAIGIYSFLFNIKEKELNIKEVLKTSSYSYLSDNVKEYIQEHYNNTGELLLTEKNKEENKPYLNPNFIKYLELSDEEKENVNVIPSVSTYYLVGDTNELNSESNSKFDLRDIDGVDYTVDYGNYGPDTWSNNDYKKLSWIEGMYSLSSSYLKLKYGTNVFDDSKKMFSIMHANLAMANDSIEDYDNKYSVISEYDYYSNKRNKNEAGSVEMFLNLAKEGLAYVPISWEETIDFDKKLPRNKTLNYNNSNYELNDANILTGMTYSYSTLSIKSKIESNGGVYMVTYNPKGSNASKNIDGNIIMGGLTDEVQDTVVHLIGYDDDYRYVYCDLNTSDYKHAAPIGETCLIGEKVEGTGAFIAKTFREKDSIVYIAYDNVSYESYAINDLIPTTEKNWDNSYEITFDSGNHADITNRYSSKREKVEKIKFYYESSRGYYPRTEAGYALDLKNMQQQSKKTLGYFIPRENIGLNTIDVSDREIYIEDDSFIILVEKIDTYSNFLKSLSVYTKNVESDALNVIADDKDIDIFDGDTKVEFIFPIKVYGISQDDNLSYKLFDNENNDITSYMQISDNILAVDQIDLKVKINDLKLNEGEYSFVIYNKGEEINRAKILFSYVGSGTGTINDPYIINEREGFKRMSKDTDSYYKLGVDIDLSGYNDFESIGTSTDPFSGVFDGDNHYIKGLNKALFNYVSLDIHHNTEIKNLTIKESNVVKDEETGYVSPFINVLRDSYKKIKWMNELSEIGDSNPFINKKLKLNNITISGVEIEKADKASSFITLAELGNENLVDINNIYITASLCTECNLYANLIYETKNVLDKKAVEIPSLNVSNVQIMPGFESDSEIEESYFFSMSNFVMSGLVGTLNTSINISNVILNNYYENYYNNYKDYHSIIGIVTNLKAIPYISLNNIYYVSGSKYFPVYSIGEENVKKLEIYEIAEDEDYDEWEDFDSYWIKDEGKIPHLKNRTFNYVDSLDVEDKTMYATHLTGIITPDNCDDEQFSSFIYLLPEGTYLANYDNTTLLSLMIDDYTTVVVGFKPGITGATIAAYDGTYKNVFFTVKDLNYTVKFDTNGGTGSIPDKEVVYGKPFNIDYKAIKKDGYKLIGWARCPECDIEVEVIDSILELKSLTAIPNDVVTLYAIWELERVDVDDYDGYIYDIKADRTANALKISIVNSYNIGEGNLLKITDPNGLEFYDDDIVYTGSKTKVYDSEEEFLKEYINVIYGDVDSNGTYDIADVYQTILHIIGKKELEDANIRAASRYYYNEIDISDAYSLLIGLIYSKLPL